MTVADDLAEALTPWIKQSPDFEDLARAVGSMWDHVELYAADQPDGTPGWLIIFDPVNCPTEALPWLATVVGERLRDGMTDAQMREWINDRPNAIRGTPKAIALAAQRSLVGGRVVQLFERTMPDGTVDPDGDNLLIYTYAADTPSEAQVWADLQDVLFVDMVCTYMVLTGPPWAEIAASETTWANVEADYPTWTEVEGGVSGGQSWDR